MNFTPDECSRLLAEMQFDSDPRKRPDEARRIRFHAGWQKATDGHTMKDQTLKRLTWENLGWRLGDTLGPMTETVIDTAFNAFAELWSESAGAPAVGGRS